MKRFIPLETFMLLVVVVSNRACSLAGPVKSPVF